MSLERLFRTPPNVRYETGVPHTSRLTINHLKNTLNRITYGHRQLKNLYNQLNRVGSARDRFMSKMHRAQTEYRYDKAFVEYIRLMKIYARLWKQIQDTQRHQQRVIRRLTTIHTVANFLNQGNLTNHERSIIVRLLHMMKNLGVAQRTLVRTQLPENVQREIRMALRDSYIRNMETA